MQATEKDALCGKMNKKRYLIFLVCLKVLSVVPTWHCFLVSVIAECIHTIFTNMHSHKNIMACISAGSCKSRPGTKLPMKNIINRLFMMVVSECLRYSITIICNITIHLENFQGKFQVLYKLSSIDSTCGIMDTYNGSK